MNRKFVEEKAGQISAHIFSNGTMRTMLYEQIVNAFAQTPDRAPTSRDPDWALEPDETKV